MPQLTMRRAVFYQFIAIIVATTLETLAQSIPKDTIIRANSDHVLSLMAITTLMCLPGYVVSRSSQRVVTKAAFYFGILLLLSYHASRLLTPVTEPLIGHGVELRPIVNYVGLGMLMLSIYATIVEMLVAKDDLHYEEERFRKLIQTTHEAVAILDRNSRLSFANPRFIEIFGIGEENVLGRPLQELIPAEYLPDFLKSAQPADRSGERFECRFRRPDRRAFDLLGSTATLTDRNGEIRGAFITLTDITAVREAERTARNSERNYREIFNATNEALFILEPDGRIRDVNNRALEMFNLEYERVRHGSVQDLTGATPSSYSAAQALEWIRKTLEQGPQLFELPIPRHDGRTLWTEIGLRASNIGGRESVIAAVRDVNERKQLEAQLRQSQKMEAIGQLAGGIAHDFNNLLQVINGYADIALDEYDCQPPTRDGITEIRNAGESASHLVAQLLAFSRRQMLKQEVLDCNASVEATLKMLRRVIGENINVVYIPGAALKPIFADRGQFEQVLLNLAVNARDAMPAGGVLTLETENVTIESEFCHAHPWAKPGEFILLRVSDTGCGMDFDTISHIWEPFFTTKEAGKGTGLGLATVYGIVRQHGGMVHVYSEPGKGTAFKIYLPAAKQVPEEAPAKMEPTVLFGNEVILLAEDNEMVRNLTRQSLEKAGYTVLAARDGLEALKLFEDEGDSVALAVLDLVMPGLGGHDVYEKVKDRFPEMPVLFASGYSANAVHTGLALSETFELIQKPYGRQDLLSRIRKLLDRNTTPKDSYAALEHPESKC